MSHDIDLILTLTGGLIAALVLGLVSQRLRLPPIVGYLLAGIAVGPFTPGFVAHHRIAAQLAEIGVVLLMFGVGLHLHLGELVAVRKVAIPGALAQIAVATMLGALVAHGAGFGLSTGLVFGLAISVASTVVLLRILVENDALHTPAGHVAVGWLLVEDLFTVVLLVLLPLFAGDRGGSIGRIALSFGGALLKIAGLTGFTLVVGRRAIPALLSYVARTRSRELFTLTVLVLALGIAVGAAQLFGASMALGAFLAGTVVSQSDFSSRAASEALPMRDAFAVLFFVAIGMLFDPAALLPNLGFVAATLVVILVAKPLAALVVVLLLRYPVRTAVTVAAALAQIGEFSFILASEAGYLGLLPERATQTLVAASIVSISLSPLLYRLVEPASRRFSARLSRGDVAPAPHPAVLEPEQRAVVVGYGPVGRTLVGLLRENSIEPTVIELNHDAVAELRRQRIGAVYGDAAQRTILEAAGVRTAGALVFSASGSPDAVIRLTKEIRPEIRILTRANYLREAAALKAAGAEVVVTSEGEVALAMAEQLMRHLGATGDELDRARNRAREALRST